MLSISKIGVSESAVRYYAKYALEQGEVQGIWVGRAAAELDLDGKLVSEDGLRNLLSGRDLLGRDLVKIGAGKSKCHTPGWDLTFSAPKSVSIVWSSCDESLRERIEKAQFNAVRNAIDYLETHSSKSRTGAGGKTSIDSTIVAGAFQHSSNREKEPQLHTHAVVANVTHCSDGRWRTLFSPHVYKDQRAISAVYKASLAHNLRELGFDIERTKHSFEISGVSQVVIDRQSSRSKSISSELEAHGLTRETASRAQKEAIVLQTRKTKGTRDHSEKARDFERWKEENEEAGFSSGSLMEIMKKGSDIKIKSVSQKVLGELAESSVERATLERSVFEKVHIHSQITEDLIGVGSYSDIKRAHELALQSRNLKNLGEFTGRAKFSTEKMLEVEKRIYDMFRKRSDEKKHVVKDVIIERVIKEKAPTITAEQRAVLEACTKSPSGLSVVEGVAGAGKSYTMNLVKEAYERAGYRVQGVSLANKAARELANSTGGMPTRSLDSLFYSMEKGGERLSSRDVLIVDEAGMIGSKKFDALLKEANIALSKVIFLGDSKQIQPIEAGQIFGAVAERFEKAELNQVIRQRDKEEAEKLLKFRNGSLRADFEEAVGYLQDKGRLHILDAAPEVTQTIAADFGKYRLENPTLESLIVSSKRESVDRLNGLIRENLKEKGEIKNISSFSFKNGGGIELGVGDQIVFTENAKKQGIFRSDIATISKIEGKIISAIRSDKKEIKFNITKFQHIKHGYAVTAHKSQGTTVDRVFVYADGPFMDKEKLYVSITRGREGNRLYADKASLGGLSWEQRQNLKELSKEEREKAIFNEYKSRLVSQISKSGQKDTTLSYRNDLNEKSENKMKDRLDGLMLSLKRGASKVMGKEKSKEKSKNTGKGKTIGIGI